MEYENEMLAKSAQADYRARAVGQAMSPGFAPTPPSVAVTDRLANLLQAASAIESVLASARERLCGGWPENANEANQLRAGGQVDALLSELGARLTKLADHAQSINARI